MYSRATTTITIYRGQIADEWSDPIDTDTPVATGIRASLLEQKQYAKGETSTQPVNLRFARLRVTRGTDVRTNDRIYDERTGETWVITNITSNQNPVIGQDSRIDLQYMG